MVKVRLFVTIRVKDASSFADAKQIASTIARSALVKTALFGMDANWGRILCATYSLSMAMLIVGDTRVFLSIRILRLSVSCLEVIWTENRKSNYSSTYF